MLSSAIYEGLSAYLRTSTLLTCSPLTLRGRKPYSGSLTSGGADEPVYLWTFGR